MICQMKLGHLYNWLLFRKLVSEWINLCRFRYTKFYIHIIFTWLKRPLAALSILSTTKLTISSISVLYWNLYSIPICRNCQWQRVKFLSVIWQKMSATQPFTEQHLLTAQDSLSKWAVFRRNCIICHNLSLPDWHLLTGLQMGSLKTGEIA